MENRQKIVMIALILIINATIAGFLYNRHPFADAQVSNINLVDTQGNEFDLYGYKGSVVILMFMETYCSACRDEAELMMQIYDECSDEVIFLSVSIDSTLDTNSALIQFKDEMGLKWTVATTSDFILSKYDIYTVPTTIIIDSELTIRQRYEGLTSKDIILNDLNNILNAKS